MSENWQNRNLCAIHEYVLRFDTSFIAMPMPMMHHTRRHSALITIILPLEYAIRVKWDWSLARACDACHNYSVCLRIRDQWTRWCHSSVRSTALGTKTDAWISSLKTEFALKKRRGRRRRRRQQSRSLYLLGFCAKNCGIRLPNIMVFCYYFLSFHCSILGCRTSCGGHVGSVRMQVFSHLSIHLFRFPRI